MRLATLTLVSLALTACDNRPAVWKGFVYPSGADLGTHADLGTFDTFEQCQSAALGVIRGFDRAEEGEDGRPAADYECGFKCAPDESMSGINVCKETRK